MRKRNPYKHSKVDCQYHRLLYVHDVRVYLSGVHRSPQKVSVPPTTEARYQIPLPSSRHAILGGRYKNIPLLNTQMVVKGKGAAFLAGIEGAHLEIRPHQILTSPPRPAG